MSLQVRLGPAGGWRVVRWVSRWEEWVAAGERRENNEELPAVNMAALSVFDTGDPFDDGGGL